MNSPATIGQVQQRAMWKPVLVFLIFLVIGPPLGGMLILLAAKILAGRPTAWDASAYREFVALVVFVSYYVGGLSALTLGLVAATFQYRNPAQLVPLWPVMIGAIAIGFVFVAFGGSKTVQPRPFPIKEISGFLGLHLAAGLGCWLIANAILWPFRRPHIPALEPT